MRKGNTRSRDSEFEQKVVEISRVTRVVAGGKRMRFRALVVIGDKKGRVGMSLKKGADVSEAVKKASGDAKKELISVPMVRGTIPHQIKAKYKASVVMLKPAPPGTGVIAGGPIRPVVEVAGISNIVCKMMGSASKINNVKATLKALAGLRQPKAGRGERKSDNKIVEKK
ncbi:MAG: 30S ribosomal protein S5 [Candidatus Doudnabacteria bacterium CG10_big_fil_rev_8_21_14_0_10_41_10]|uniref:Small ribosomal subunit protein uS5 n=1 Tax=Candidatus Doudnabacteria bacterium CG10_big_fil_rev_8_21_14_0_10_41_10 TaxID=1974551 RepID=A0A2H0VDJ1_9BACT|nr:MAG: 30S ribosomal protein S5 [Candidatus Doudnabacteria bacterium CG10_big_fil_rev_8_21_14_0_10_41_10]